MRSFAPLFFAASLASLTLFAQSSPQQKPDKDADAKNTVAAALPGSKKKSAKEEKKEEPKKSEPKTEEE